MPHLTYLLLQLLAFVCFSAATLTLNAGHIPPNDIHAPSSPMRSSLRYASNRSPIARNLYELPNGWVRTIWHISCALCTRSGSQAMLWIKYAAFRSEMLTNNLSRSAGSTNSFHYCPWISPPQFSKTFIMS